MPDNELTRRIAELLPQFVVAARNGLVALAFFVVLIYAIEWYYGADRNRYLTRNFRTDFVYNVFYRGGIYVFLVYMPIAHFARPSFSVDLSSRLPLPVAVVSYWLVRDFLAYWMHRWQHASSFLWRFHQVHHSQDQMTLLTASRFHVVDQIGYHVLMFLPIWVFFGNSPGSWFPIYLTTEFLLFVQHSEVPWGFGPLRVLLVSPDFHAVHHSADPRHHHRNFGMLFSIWDYVFGTAVRTERRPEKLGIEGWNEPESFLRHLLLPFRGLVGAKRASTAEAPTPGRESG